jgi:hypothetical protein
MSAAGSVWAVAVGKQSATKTKTTGNSPQTIGGKVGGSFGESKMRQQTLTVFLLPEQVRRRTSIEPGRSGRIAGRSSAVEAGGSEGYRKSAMQSRRK